MTAYNFFSGDVRTASPGVVHIYGQITTTTSGTIGSVQIPGGGASVVKTATEAGRYTLTLAPTAGVVFADLVFMAGYASLIGTTDAIFTQSKGLVSAFRNNAISTTGTIDIQFVDPNGATVTVPDAEVPDAAVIVFCLAIGNRNVV